MKFKELTTKSEAEVRKMLEDLLAEAHEFTLKVKMNQEKQTHKVANFKKDIARIKTYLSSLTK